MASTSLLATRDPDEFPEPTEVRFDRQTASRHLAFGGGAHRCTGSHLARQELVVAVRELLARLPEFRLGDDADPRSHAGSVVGLGRLPLAWA